MSKENLRKKLINLRKTNFKDQGITLIQFNRILKKLNLKEKDITELSKNQEDLKNEIDANRNYYETLVDKTTLELENFIKRNDPDTKTQ